MVDQNSNSQTDEKEILAKAKGNVLVKSEEIDMKQIVKGYDFNNGVDYAKLFDSYKYFGFQATNVGKAIEIVKDMVTWKLSKDPIDPEDSDYYKDPKIREKTRCTIYLGYTSNMVSSGLRETFRFLCEHKLVDYIVTTAGGVEEDFIKCLANTVIGDFALKGKELRDKGINRIGNLLVPNENYCLFEDWITPILNEMVEIQKNKKKVWTPRKIIKFLGMKINNPESIYYWCWKNKIKVFCPAITDGSLGDMMFFHSFSKQGLIIDILGDLIKLNKSAIGSKKTGMIILGGGIVKHHINNANLMRNGADYAVYINTGQEFDGSDAGARPDEAVSWGKIKPDALQTKVYAEASIVFPIIVAETFAKLKDERKDEIKK